MATVLRPEQKRKDIISRMSQGLVACAECRRMKLKCDKKVPCGSCVRRECSSVCPTGVLISRQAYKAILAEGSSEQRTQDDITRLRERKLQLENALALAHSCMSKDIHPLLAESPHRGRPQEDPEVDKVTDVLGSLTVSESGELKYFGPSAMVEALHQAVGAGGRIASSLVSPQPELESRLESTPTKTSLSSTLSMESFASAILNDLPKKKRAWFLCENFYEHYPTYLMPILQEELFQAYLSPVYKYLKDSHTNPSIPIPSIIIRPHRCAVIFLALAIGAWLDLTQEHYWIEAERYFRIGMACLSMQSLLFSPEVASVQALFLLIIYSELRGAASTTTMSPSWTILSLACKVAQGLGLHRDPSHWNFDETTVQHRRWLYWELVSTEIYQCVATGRPLSIRPSYVDTELPDDLGRSDTHDQPLTGFFRWKHETARDCYLDVVETLLAAAPANYESILELDRKVRAREIPAHLNKILVNVEDEPNLTFPEFMHTCNLGVARSRMLLSIHRSHLSEALKDPSGNPLRSRYAPSFLASFRAASWVVRSFQAAHKRFPALFARLWNPWTAVSNAAMVLGDIAIHAPSSTIGNGPLEELRVASAMFEEVAAQTVSHRTKNGAKIVQKILAQAEEAQALHSSVMAGVAKPSISIPPTNYGDDELAIFGGQDRLLPMEPHSTSLEPGAASSYHFDSSSLGSLDDAHPSLIDFLNTAPMTQVASSATTQEMQMTTFLPLFSSPFSNLGLMSPQMEGWKPSKLPTPQYHYDIENIDGSFTSGLQTDDTFENYLDLHAPVDLDQETSTITPC
ncbi:fungal-specific transcription factor domain-containing protein [Flagelloscypha sp. PMI_526]|nr:fungal-specific transcription factor domain-containing protein [Flagelloscypha sp. PMI_526]